jgi:hypothetical protein
MIYHALICRASYYALIRRHLNIMIKTVLLILLRDLHITAKTEIQTLIIQSKTYKLIRFVSICEVTI